MRPTPVHGVEADAECGAATRSLVEQPVDRGEVEDLVHQREVVEDGVDDLDGEAGVVDRVAVGGDPRDVDVHVDAQLVLLDGLGPLVDVLHQDVRGRACTTSGGRRTKI